MFTTEQWKVLELELSSPYHSVRLKIDGYKVVLEARQAAPLRYEIMVFVNGWSKGEWLLKDCEERRRFMRPITRPLYSAARKRQICGRIKKRDVAKYFPDIDKKLTYHTLSWPTFKPLMRHLIKNNQSIELDTDEVTR